MGRIDEAAARRSKSRWSLWSEDSVLCVGSKGSFLSIGSIGSAFSVGSVGSFFSAFSIGSAGSGPDLAPAPKHQDGADGCGNEEDDHSG